MEQIKKKYLSENNILTIVLIAFGISYISSKVSSSFSQYLTYFWFKLDTPLESTYDLIGSESRLSFISVLLLLFFEKANNSSDFLDLIKRIIGKKNENMSGKIATISAAALSLITTLIIIPLFIMIIIKWSSMSAPIDF